MSTGQLPERVNHRKLATEKRKLEGSVGLDQFTRLTQALLLADGSGEGDVEAELSFRKGHKRAGLLVGKASAVVKLQCQRCMQLMSYELKAKYRHQLVNSEEALAKLEEDDDGILCLEDMVSISDLLEDELLLGLPMVAKHQDSGCLSDEYQIDNDQIVEQNMHSDASDKSGDTYKPFAGLAELTKAFEEKG